VTEKEFQRQQSFLRRKSIFGYFSGAMFKEIIVRMKKKMLSQLKMVFFRFLFFAFLVKHFELKQGRRELLKLIQVENTSWYNIFYASTSLCIVRKLAAAAFHNSTFSIMNAKLSKSAKIFAPL